MHPEQAAAIKAANISFFITYSLLFQKRRTIPPLRPLAKPVPSPSNRPSMLMDGCEPRFRRYAWHVAAKPLVAVSATVAISNDRPDIKLVIRLRGHTEASQRDTG
ncbi:protein of unknown function [Burkholderia multivorans]